MINIVFVVYAPINLYTAILAYPFMLPKVRGSGFWFWVVLAKLKGLNAVTLFLVTVPAAAVPVKLPLVPA
jgi:hypothetical protein